MFWKLWNFLKKKKKNQFKVTNCYKYIIIVVVFNNLIVKSGERILILGNRCISQFFFSFFLRCWSFRSWELRPWLSHFVDFVNTYLKFLMFWKLWIKKKKIQFNFVSGGMRYCYKYIIILVVVVVFDNLIVTSGNREFESWFSL